MIRFAQTSFLGAALGAALCLPIGIAKANGPDDAPYVVMDDCDDDDFDLARTLRRASRMIDRISHRLGYQPPPPQPQFEFEAQHPSGHSVWAQGFWNWDGDSYEWRRGRWVQDRPGYTFVQAAWKYRGNRWVFSAGHFEPDDNYRRYR